MKTELNIAEVITEGLALEVRADGKVLIKEGCYNSWATSVDQLRMFADTSARLKLKLDQLSILLAQ